MLDPSRADRLDLAFLQRAQELGLDGKGELADLVEHQRPSVRLGEKAAARLRRAGERPARVPEKLGFRQLAGNGRAVEAHERRLCAPALRVDERSDQLLARSGVAPHQHGDVARCHARDRVGQPAHRRRVAHDAAPDRLLRRQPAVLHAQRARFQGPVDDQPHLLDVEGLGDVLVGAGLHRAHRDALRAVGGQKDHGQRFVALADGLQELHAVHLRHRVIGYHGIYALEVRERLRPRPRQDRLVPALLGQFLQGEQHPWFVVNEQKARQGSSPAEAEGRRRRSCRAPPRSDTRASLHAA